MAEVFRALPMPPAVILVNNRRLAEGFFLGAGAKDPAAALRAIDKLAKIGPARVRDLLVIEAGLTEQGRRRVPGAGADPHRGHLVRRARSVRSASPTSCSTRASTQLAAVVDAAARRMPGAVVADLKIARGLDYYTGTVYETELIGHEDFGSICSGGRYDALASDGRRTYPGVGISLGVSRLLGALIGRGLVRATRSVPTCVLVAVNDEPSRAESAAIATALRARGIPAEVAPKADKFGKQIRYADRRGIPFVWFPVAGNAEGSGSVKDIRSGEQVDADPTVWSPPAADLHPRVERLDAATVASRAPADRIIQPLTRRTHDPHARGRHPARRPRRPDRHARRLDRPAPRPRRRRLPGPAGRLGHRPGGRPRPGCGSPAAQRVLRQGRGRGRASPRGQREPRAGHRRRRGDGHGRSRCSPSPRRLPFPIDDHVDVGEEARLRYRYLDLRRPEPARILRLRSKVSQIAREVLYERDFLEIETPTLTRSTPEGARDFLVPVRLQPGSWYALPQSPQLFKQLLMVAGMERYFQIARCYRDEDFRKDRQPEFTQLDIEMSFVEQADVLEVGEAVIRAIWAGTVGYEIGEIPHMTYAEAMRRFGSDKPDLRFGVELIELTGVLRRARPSGCSRRRTSAPS